MPPNVNAPVQTTESMRQIVEQLGNANNVLITVSNDPSVDQLAACIGLTLALNHQGKHATAVFSGAVPSTLEFLQPEKTIEKNTNSLRDFIISLDKAKADKLRYKVEDEFVKIFITPYRTSIGEADFTYSQGDFNIDLVITLGVHERQQLDAAIIAHGRILHDAPVVSLNTDSTADLGTINWVDTQASSLCEMAADLIAETSQEQVDSQIATAFLTGMVAETDRFGNEKATPHTMSIAGVLMAAGASTQLISAKLDEPIAIPVEDAQEAEPSNEIPSVVEDDEVTQEETPTPRNDGFIEIDHSHDDDIAIDEHGKFETVAAIEDQLAEEQAAIAEEEQAAVDDADTTNTVEESSEAGPLPEESTENTDSRLILDPPQLGGQLTANSIPEHEQYAPAIDPLAGGQGSGQILSPSTDTEPVQPPVFAQPDAQNDIDIPEKTLSDLEKELDSPHVQEDVPPPPSVDDAMANVTAAINSDDTYRPEPLNAVGSTNVDLGLSHDPMDQIRAEEATNEQDQDDNNSSQNSAPPVPPPFNPGV